METDEIHVLIIIEGMLASAATVSLIARSLRDYNITKSVVDPVCCLFQRVYSNDLLMRA